MDQHAFVGAGTGRVDPDGQGTRAHNAAGEPQARYPVSELAARYGAGVEEETTDPAQAYATAEWFRRAAAVLVPPALGVVGHHQIISPKRRAR